MERHIIIIRFKGAACRMSILYSGLKKEVYYAELK